MQQSAELGTGELDGMTQEAVPPLPHHQLAASRRQRDGRPSPPLAPRGRPVQPEREVTLRHHQGEQPQPDEQRPVDQ